MKINLFKDTINSHCQLSVHDEMNMMKQWKLVLCEKLILNHTINNLVWNEISDIANNENEFYNKILT